MDVGRAHSSVESRRRKRRKERTEKYNAERSRAKGGEKRRICRKEVGKGQAREEKQLR